MYHQGDATPCPGPLGSGRTVASPFESKHKQNIFDDAFDHFNDDTTQNIARLVQEEFKRAPPRRTQGLAQKPRRNAPVSVFHDASSQREALIHGEPEKCMRSSAINARPAQKIRLQNSRNENSIAHFTSNHRLSKDGPDHLNMAQKHDRRRTIWIPSDDTTVLSIHPGAYDHTLQDRTIGLPANDLRTVRETPRQPALGASAMRQVQKMTSAGPKRALNSIPATQANTSRDVMGSGGGKENIPPGTALSQGGKKGKLGAVLSDKATTVSSRHPQMFMQQTTAAKAKSANLKKRSAAELKEAPKAKAQARFLDARGGIHNRPLNEMHPSLSTIRAETGPKKIAVFQENSKPPAIASATTSAAPKNLSIPNVRASTSASRYPVLSEDLDHPELYEDSWLQRQEVALTQLVNSVFQQATPASNTIEVPALRRKILSIYHDSSVASMNKRLKASLVYGALSMPKDASNIPKLREDIGLRGQFLDVFINSYNAHVLQAAVEAITGRAVTSTNRTSADVQSDESKASTSATSKELKRFFLTFFIHHEDSAELLHAHKHKLDKDAALQAGTIEWFWQRTVLRSLMLIHLLDQMKITRKFSPCLFQASSPFKSSTGVLQAMAKLLLPSIGDIARPLGHLDYSVAHVQNPLDEYTYRIDNLAVDLRDGVLLTHFVELLIHPPSSLNAEQDRTVTLSLPEEQTLTSIVCGHSNDRILSQHLKLPCIGRVQKTYNIQIALSALASVRGLAGSVTENIKAEDIVNGHREKTLSLLWALVSKWGLAFLVDWNELKKETRRFSKDSMQLIDATSATATSDQPDLNQQGSLLKVWAASVCQSRRVPITNLTTSFADGRALAAIISAYADFLPDIASRSTTTSSIRTSTADRLRTLGCSESFISLFTSHATTIPSRNTTISLLAFLASRLLPLARAHRAVCTIQHAYRLRLARRAISQRVQSMKAANECAAVAKQKIREVEAAITLQRAWRRVLNQRIEGLERDVRDFQAVARAWAVRKACNGVLGGGTVRRVMGGW